MAKRQKRSGSGFLMGLVIGIAVGATVVWVLTPQPRELEAMKLKATQDPTTGAGAGPDGALGADGADGVSSATGATTSASPTILDLAMAAVERVRGRFDEAVALGREAYEQGQTEVMQRFNQARSAE